MSRFLKEGVIIFLIASLTGLLYNSFLGKKLPLLRPLPEHSFFSLSNVPEYSDLTASIIKDTLFVDLQTAKIIFDSGWAVFIDARPQESLKDGYIKNAINIPYNDVENKLTELLSVPVDTPIVVYCDGADCQASVRLTSLLQSMGYKYVYVFFGGWLEWQNNGLPVDTMYPK